MLGPDTGVGHGLHLLFTFHGVVALQRREARLGSQFRGQFPRGKVRHSPV